MLTYSLGVALSEAFSHFNTYGFVLTKMLAKISTYQIEFILPTEECLKKVQSLLT